VDELTGLNREAVDKAAAAGGKGLPFAQRDAQAVQLAQVVRRCRQRRAMGFSQVSSGDRGSVGQQPPDWVQISGQRPEDTPGHGDVDHQIAKALRAGVDNAHANGLTYDSP
jgi:hypothetical protein